jgi:DNA-binding transcriptional regulator PaaX
MGTLEDESKRQTRKGQIQKIILGTIATVGLLSAAAVAPNALQALGLIMRLDGKRKYSYAIESSRKRLLQNGLIEYTERGFVKLTQKGEAKLRQLELCDYKFAKPRKWDKKWRVLIFDIHENQKPMREKIRRTLISIGFEKLQLSVWVYPYDCEDLITLLKADFKIGKAVLYLIVDKMENDGWLKKRFNL